jgi:peptidyl-tRNA hydrolase
MKKKKKKKKEKTLELWLKDTQKKIHKKIVSTRFMAL